MDKNTVLNRGQAIDFDTPVMQRSRKRRALKDRFGAYGIAAGGLGVILAVLLIFFYLLYEVMPMFAGASMEREAGYPVPGSQAETLFMTTEEQSEIGMRLAADGEVVFFDTRTGAIKQQFALPVNAAITSFAEDQPASRLLAVGLANGSALIFKHSYRIRYLEDNQRVITPFLEYPYGEEPLTLDAAGAALEHISVSDGEESLALASVSASGDTALVVYEKEEDFFSGEIVLERELVQLPPRKQSVHALVLEPDHRWLFILQADGHMELFDYRERSAPVLNSRVQAIEGDATLTTVRLLLGGISLLLGDSNGNVAQWFLVRDADGQYHPENIRSFQHGDQAVAQLAIEHRRKGFASLDVSGELGLYNTTAHRKVLTEPVVEGSPLFAAISPRANSILIEDDNRQLGFWTIDNEHPEISWSSLWGKVWYESYPEPDYIWQSSSASNDFEPKLSLAPLAFGTLKAAFYAMLLAAPLAICGAMYTAFFMAPSLRRKVKPFIELMEALPTVILGFLAGLWLAPLVEANLPGIFSLLLIMPLSFLLFGYVWTNLPGRIRYRVPDGWGAALLMPVVLGAAWLSFAMSQPLESAFFGGDMRSWISNDLGVTFDQRNSLVVGFAMGFAVIPTIFSIAEDALFSVPRHLVNGSLALGATPWQTLMRVVLPTASPGIFSGLMIGLGRAVGETMIVLMATGNTPIMDINIFEGMRTLAANIAVEMPESEVGSTHYRTLFLAAFVLFLFTFVFNTAAELVRQRLRAKYGSL